jgi:hypothetical protein
MISIAFIFMGVVTALAVFAILAKTCAGEPKRAEKWEKGEIIKHLLALSERENSISAIASPPRRYSLMSPNPPIPLRPNLTDAEIEEQIRQRAYELYQGRGGADGNATDDWLQAREEVSSNKAKATTSTS